MGCADGAGSRVGIRPFGVEAQRLLRLEKGHIIIGQDTDGLTTPLEAALEWALKMDKPFFVGQRSLQHHREAPAQAQAGRLRSRAAFRGPAPKECHLVIRDGEIAGRVTSIAYSPSARAASSAWPSSRRRWRRTGTRFKIRVDGGPCSKPQVVTTPFYDPRGERQSMSRAHCRPRALSA